MHQIDVGCIRNLQQHNRQITGNCIAPQARLSPAVIAQHGSFGPQRRVGVEDGTSEPPKILRVGLRRIELAQEYLAVGPCKIKDAVCQMAILIFVNQLQAAVASLPDARDQIGGSRLPWVKTDQVADCDNGIENRALAARKRRGTVHRLRVRDCSSPANKSCAVSFVGYPPNIGAMYDHQMEHPGRLFIERSRPARTENRPPRFQYLRLHEEIAESRMEDVRGRRGENNFGVAGYLNNSAFAGTVGERDSP